MPWEEIMPGVYKGVPIPKYTKEAMGGHGLYQAWIVYKGGEVPYQNGRVLTWGELHEVRKAYGDVRWEPIKGEGHDAADHE